MAKILRLAFLHNRSLCRGIGIKGTIPGVDRTTSSYICKLLDAHVVGRLRYLPPHFLQSQDAGMNVNRGRHAGHGAQGEQRRQSARVTQGCCHGGYSDIKKRWERADNLIENVAALAKYLRQILSTLRNKIKLFLLVMKIFNFIPLTHFEIKYDIHKQLLQFAN